MVKNKSFLGTGWAFPPTFQKESAAVVQMASGEKDIEQSLEILMGTVLGERIMLPDFGSDLQAYLFKSISNSEVHFLKELIRTAIVNYESRIILEDIQIDTTKYQEGIISIGLNYTVETTNTRFNLVFPYYQVEGTHIPQLFRKNVQSEIIPE
jgi:phage baseplate assembly protein W